MNKGKKKYYKEYQREYRLSNKEKAKEYRQKNKEYYKEYYQENKKKFKEYYQENKEKEKEYRERNKEKRNENAKKYYQKNKEKKKEYQKENREKKNEYEKKRRKTDIKFRLDGNMGAIIRICLKGKKAGRKWETLVGYTIEDLINHLESKFEDWMNWDNYGKININKKTWNLDHIKPRSLFNYETAEDEEFKKCWALENLQPLDAMENLKKSNNFF